jgi:1-acylglycerone phosphate reductase
VVEQSLDEMQEVWETNCVGALRVTQAAVPSMIQRRSGLVLMVGSVTSMMSTPWAGAYAASKAALLSLTDALRLELQPFDVGVTYVMAGAIK